MTTYYRVIATLEDEDEMMFGSFVKRDCTYEIQAERDSWKDEGYRNIRIVPEQTEEEPDTVVYKDELHLIH